MLIRTEGRSNPLAEISSIASFWFFWGTLFGIFGLATAQRVIHAVDPNAGQEQHGPSTEVPTDSPNPPASAGPSGL